MTIDIDELLPCPFCGCEVELVLDHTVELTDWIRHKGTPCGVEFSGQRGEVIAAWNSRPSAIVEEPMAVAVAVAVAAADESIDHHAYRVAHIPEPSRSPQPHTGRAAITEAMTDAFMEELNRQGVAMDDFSPPIYPARLIRAALNASLTVEPEADKP